MKESSELRSLQQGCGLEPPLQVWVQTGSIRGTLCVHGTEVCGREARKGGCDMQGVPRALVSKEAVNPPFFLTALFDINKNRDSRLFP